MAESENQRSQTGVNQTTQKSLPALAYITSNFDARISHSDIGQLTYVSVFIIYLLESVVSLNSSHTVYLILTLSI